MMRLRLAPLAPALLLAACAGATSGYRPFLELCGDPAAPPERAADVCARALATEGLDPVAESAAAINLGAALLDLGRPEAAERAYDRAVAAGARPALAHEGRAKARAALGRTAEAGEDWSRAVELAPRDPETRKGRSAFRLTTGDAAGALEDAEAGLARAPEDEGLAVNRALALSALGRTAEAERALARVLRESPDDPRLFIARASLRSETDPAAGLADLDCAVELDPAAARVWRDRGRLLDRLGRSAEADESFRRAFELGLRSAEVAERVETMSR